MTARLLIVACMIAGCGPGRTTANPSFVAEIQRVIAHARSAPVKRIDRPSSTEMALRTDHEQNLAWFHDDVPLGGLVESRNANGLRVTLLAYDHRGATSQLPHPRF